MSASPWGISEFASYFTVFPAVQWHIARMARNVPMMWSSSLSLISSLFTPTTCLVEVSARKANSQSVSALTSSSAF